VVELSASSAISGERVDVSARWTELTADRPALRLVRRRRADPRSVLDGRTVVDLQELFLRPTEDPSRSAWPRVDRLRWVTDNSPAEGGRDEASLVLWWLDGASEPSRAWVRWAADGGEPGGEAELVGLTRVEHSAGTMVGGTFELLSFFDDPGTGEELRAELRVNHLDTGEHQWQWLPVSGPSVTRGLDRTVLERTRSVDESEEAGVSYTVGFSTTRVELGDDLQPALSPDPVEGARVVTEVALSDLHDPDHGTWARSLDVRDGGLEGGVHYNYRLFRRDLAAPSGYASQRRECATALATTRHDIGTQLYGMLPAIHRTLDEPVPGQHDGELRRFMSLFGAGLDHIRTSAEALRDRHVAAKVPAKLLPALGRTIGWEVDRTIDTIRQRRDIELAPELYATVGTLPNVVALVNRITGWACETKEFVHNVARTNVPELIRLWDLWQQVETAGVWGPASRETGDPDGPDVFDGRPTGLVVGASAWRYWHSDRSGRWTLLRQEIGGGPVETAVPPPADDALDDRNPWPQRFAGETWLFWDSNRSGGARDIWVQRGVDAPEPITDHTADDLRPCAVQVGTQLWLFWQSLRRGVWDIWAQTYDGATWGPPTRLFDSDHPDEAPTAALVGTELRVVWARHLGARRALFESVWDGAAWSEPAELPMPSPSPTGRDEGPALVVDGGGALRLFWASNHDGRWQIMGRIHGGASWSDPEPVTAHPLADREPGAMLDAGGELRLWWRSQRRGRAFQTRTWDFEGQPPGARGATTMVANMGTVADRAHYVYDTRRTNDPFDDAHYARDVVGLHVTPDIGSEAAIRARLRRASDMLEPFRPAIARYVWLRTIEAPPPLEPELESELFAEETLAVDSWIDELP
jgi:phage tail-like protein